MSSSNIKVAIKARPILKREKDNKLVSQWKIVNNSIRPIDSQTEPFCFDHVFDQDASNRDIFHTVVKPIVDAAVNGFNGTIFAYGQTSSGKTYTMLGDDNNPGIMVLTAKEIFKEIELAVDRQFLLKVGYIEIYNEKIFDLLNKTNIDLRLETHNGEVTVVNCEEPHVTSEESLMKYLQAGSKHRRIGETNMNERSSRSHSIFRIIIESCSIDNPDEGAVQISILNLVDLAGSERADQTGATGTRLKEGAHINKSLLYLSRVIKSLSENEHLKYISYRDSKLTRILQASLGGNALTAIICNINPTAVEETNSTLNFAMRAKSIKNKPQVNEILSDSASIKRLQKEIARLESELQVEKSKNSKVKVIQLERQIYEEGLKFVHSHSRSSDVNLRRRTWSVSVHPASNEPVPAIKPSSALPLKLTTPLITLRGDTLPPFEEFKGSDDLNEFSILNDPKDIVKTPEVFRQKNRRSFYSPADNNTRCRQVERELEELRDFTNLEKKFNVEHEVVASLNRKLDEAQEKILEYEKEKFEIFSAKLDEWHEKEEALSQRYLNLENEMTDKNKILEALKNRETDYKTQFYQFREQIKTLQMELSEKNGKEYEVELYQQKAKNRERELLETLEDKDKKIKSLNEKLMFANDMQNLHSVRRSNVITTEKIDLKNLCEKCKEYDAFFKRIETENVMLRKEKSGIQKESDELSLQLMEAIQECDCLRSQNEKLQTELTTLKEENISVVSTEETKVKLRDNILRYYQELLVYLPELSDESAKVNCLSFWNLFDLWEIILKKCIDKFKILNEDIINHKTKESKIQNERDIGFNDALILKKEKNDFLESLRKYEDDTLNLNSLVQTQDQEISELTDELSAIKTKVAELQKERNAFFDDTLILKNRNRDLLEKLRKHEDKKLMLDSLVETQELEISKLNDELVAVKSKLDLLLIDNSELRVNANDLRHELIRRDDAISELKCELKDLRATPQNEWLRKFNNLEPLRAENDILCAGLSESTKTISQQVNEIKHLTMQIEILEQQVNKEKTLCVTQMDSIGASTDLVNENIFVDKNFEKIKISESSKLDVFDEFIINLDVLKFVMKDNTAYLHEESSSEEYFAKLKVKDIIKDHDSLIYFCEFNQGIVHNVENENVTLLKGNIRKNVKLEINILKSEFSDKVVEKEAFRNSDSIDNTNNDLPIENDKSKQDVQDYSKSIEATLTKLDSEVSKMCSLLNKKVQWLEEKLLHLENRIIRNKNGKAKTQMDPNGLFKEQTNLLQQAKNIESVMLEKMIELDGIVEAFSVKFQSIEKLRDALEKFLYKMKHQSESLMEKKTTIEKANDNLNVEISSLKNCISTAQAQICHFKTDILQLEKNLVEKETIILEQGKENDRLAKLVRNLESTILIQTHSEEENLKKVMTLEGLNKDLLNQSQQSIIRTEVAKNQLSVFEIENCEFNNNSHQKEKCISDLIKEKDKILKQDLCLEKSPGEENYKKLLIEEHLNTELLDQCQQSKDLTEDVKDQLRLIESKNCELKNKLYQKEECISNLTRENAELAKTILSLESEVLLEKDFGREKNEKFLILEDLNKKLLNQYQELKTLNENGIFSNSKLEKDIKKTNNLLKCIYLCIKDQFELLEHNNSQNHSGTSKIDTAIQDIAEDTFSLKVLNEKLEDLLKQVQHFAVHKQHELELLKDKSNLLRLENSSLKSEIFQIEKRNDELQKKLLDLNKNKEYLENKVQKCEKTIARTSCEKDAINVELKVACERYESLEEEIKCLKDMKNELEKKRDILCEENSKLQIEIGKSNDLIKHTEEDCMTLKLSVSSLRDKVLQLEKERNTLQTRHIKYDDIIEGLRKDIINLTSQNTMITTKFDTLSKDYFANMEKHQEKTELCRSLEEKIITLQIQHEQCKSKNYDLEMQGKALEMHNQQLSLKSELLNKRVNVLCAENEKILKDCNEECERLRILLNTGNESKKLQDTNAALELCEKRVFEERSLQVHLQKKMDDISKKLELITSEYNACLLQIQQHDSSDIVDINDDGSTKRDFSSNNSLLKQLHEMQKMHLFKSKQLQNQIKTLETAHAELLQSVAKTQGNTFRQCFSAMTTKDESNNKSTAVSSDLRHVNHNSDHRHQKIINNLMGENKQLRIKNEKLEAELTSTRSLSQKDRKSRRQSTHDEKRQSLWDSTCEVGTMTQPTDQLCNCEQFDLKVKELKTQLRIKDCQINTLLLEMKANPLKEENESLKNLLAEEECDKKKLRIEIFKLKQELLDQANQQKECLICASKVNKHQLDKDIQTDEDFCKLQRKCEDLKLICRMRKDTIRELEDRLNTEKENEANNKQNPIEKCLPFENVQIAQEVLEALKEENRILKKKYEQSKIICISRGEEVQSLEAKLKTLNFDA